MATFNKIDLSSVSKDDEQIKFQTYLNYLTQFKQFIINQHGTDENAARYIWSQMSGLQGSKTYSIAYLERSLFLTWNTETIALNLGLNDPAVLKINNHWKPIQVYYAIYTCAEAVAHLINLKDRFSHKECLRIVSDFLIQLNTLPWAYAYKGNLGKTGREAESVNFPPNIRLEHNLKTANVDPIEQLATCLHAEHKKRVHDLFYERTRNRRKGQKNIHKYQTDPGATTLLHFAYRLRIRSNYEGADIYLARLTDDQIRRFDSLLNDFCAYTLMALEIIVMRKISKKSFFEIYNSFSKRVDLNITLSKRIKIYQALT